MLRERQHNHELTGTLHSTAHYNAIRSILEERNLRHYPAPALLWNSNLLLHHPLFIPEASDILLTVYKFLRHPPGEYLFNIRSTIWTVTMIKKMPALLWLGGIIAFALLGVRYAIGSLPGDLDIHIDGALLHLPIATSFLISLLVAELFYVLSTGVLTRR